MRYSIAACLCLTMLSACSASKGERATLNSASITAGPTLSAPRATHALVRTGDGRLAVIGGCVRNGCESGPASATVDIISADASRIERTGQLLARRVQPSAAALADGTILVIGGWVDGRVSATTEIFDPVKGVSVRGPDMLGPRSSATIAALTDGTILVAGGYDGSRARVDAEIFDPAVRRFTPAGELRQARSGATGTRLRDGKVLLVGGGDGESAGRRALASTEIFDPATRTFSPSAKLANRRYKHGAVLLPSGDVLIIGGSDERDYRGKLRSVERYDHHAMKFVPAGELAVPRFKLTDGVLLVEPGRILIAAGDDHPEIFDVANGRGALLESGLGGQWNYLTATQIGPGTAFLAGGYREGRIEPTDRSWILRL